MLISAATSTCGILSRMYSRAISASSAPSVASSSTCFQSLASRPSSSFGIRIRAFGIRPPLRVCAISQAHHFQSNTPSRACLSHHNAGGCGCTARHTVCKASAPALLRSPASAPWPSSCRRASRRTSQCRWNLHFGSSGACTGTPRSDMPHTRHFVSSSKESERSSALPFKKLCRIKRGRPSSSENFSFFLLKHFSLFCNIAAMFFLICICEASSSVQK